MFNKIKQSIILRAVKKRKQNSTFDDIASESFQLAPDAKTDQNNSYYFTAHNADTSFFLRLGKRGGGAHEVWFAFCNKATGDAFVDFGVYTEKTCPVKLTCVEPLKEWHIDFCGTVERAKPDSTMVMQTDGNKLQAKFAAKFFCTEKLYEFSRDSDDLPFAKAVAAEKWNKQFFAALKQNTQVHTEQAGNLCGKLTVDGTAFEISAPALRDHSFGKREWGYMNRHIWLAAMSQNQHFNLSRVSYPDLFELKTGYHFKEGTLTNVVDAPSMWQTSNESKLPNEFSFDVKMKNGKIVKCRCNPKTAFLFLMGGDYLIFEGIAEFEIDEKPCFGIAEFGFNTTETRWKKQK